MMNLDQIMQNLADRLRLQFLSADERGRYVLNFDGWLDVEVRLLDRSTVLIEAEVGREPEDEWAVAAYLENVLTRSVLDVQRSEEAVCLDPRSRRLLLNRREGLSELSADRLEAVLERFTNRAEEWTEFLAEDDRSTVSTASMPVRMLMP